MATAASIVPFDKVVQLERVYQSLDLLTRFIHPALPFINSHLTEFYTQDYWNSFLATSLRNNLESKSIEEVKGDLNNLVNGNWRDFRNKNASTANDDLFCTFDTAATFQDLIIATAQLQLSEMGLSVPVKKLSINGIGIYENSSPTDNSLQLDKIMSAKKTHEVEVMSDFITKISVVALNPGNSEGNTTSIKYLVDVGSGKGYLSSYLTLLHEFKVLAIDSSSTNTNGCEKRSEKLEKVWAQLVRRAVERKLYGKCEKRGKNSKSKKKVLPDESSNMENVPESVGPDGVSKFDEGDSKSESSKEFSDGIKSSSSIPTTSKGSNGDNKLQTLTQFVTPDYDLYTSLRKSFSVFTVETSSSIKIDQDENLLFAIVGLHTCGDLGVASLRLFISNEKAKFICNVPCCYHLLEENHLNYPSIKFQGSKAVKRDYKTSGSLKPSFPICRKLNVEDSGRVYLGRNARMMSALSIEKMTSTEKGLDLHPSVFNRCVLQTLIKTSLGEEYLNYLCTEYKVGKIGDKCRNFKDYVRLGLQNLHLDAKIKPSDDDIEKLFSLYCQEEKKRLQKYYLLRSLFATIVEGIILLDRLAFLLEHPSVTEAYIVELFDPAVSPRCHAIVAVKK